MGGKIENPFTVIVADPDGRYERVIAEADRLSVGRGAFDAACREFPESLIYYQHGARTIAKRPAPPPISRLPAPERARLALDRIHGAPK